MNNKLLDNLNERQLEAVQTDSQYVLLLAGAGSGKTKTLTTRIINLIDELGVNPRSILAVTFTNKAANEMKERVANNLKNKSDVTIKTFHSFGAYILRVECFASGRTNNFQIYDDDDSKKIMLSVLKKFDYSKSILANFKKWVSTYKQNLEDPSKMEFKDPNYFEMYSSYNRILEETNCFDFEDLILQPVKIFSKYQQILQKYRTRYKHILIDEYQDTNLSQYELVKLLCGNSANLMVVGDEDQSIYRFRGADVNIILNFPEDFKNSKTIRLEENYRSTSNILNLANNVIKNNIKRLGKNLFTSGAEGEKATLFKAYNEIDESEKTIRFILENDYDFNETAILFRTNYQSRAYETIFNKNKIPYVVVGSIAFFEREEIKDSIALLKWIANPKDKISFERFINKPARGIGDKTLAEFYNKSKNFDNDLWKTLENIVSQNCFSKKLNDNFTFLWNIFKNKNEVIEEKNISELLVYYLEQLELIEYFKKTDELENTEKINNLNEFCTSIINKGKGIDELLKFLEEFTLTASSLNKEENETKKIKLMTIHNAKGLEFDNVFIGGVETGLFPHINSNDDDDIEEERRLFYVAITRARKNLFISYCEIRNVYGREDFRGPSEFIFELKKDFLQLKYFTENDISELDCNNGIDLDFNDDNYYHDDDYIIKSPKSKKHSKKVNFKKDDVVKHKDYGKGKILNVNVINKKHLATIDFWDYSCMELILEYVDLEKIND